MKHSDTEFTLQSANDAPDMLNASRFLSGGYFAHFHNNIEIYCVYSGNVTTYIDEHPYSLSAGTAIVVNNLHLHRYEMQEQAEIGCVIVGSKYLSAFTESFPNRTLPTMLADKTANIPIFKIITEMAQISKFDEFQKHIYANCLIRAIVTAYGTAEKKQSEKKHAAIIDIVNYIYTHYAEDISLNSLAKELGYAPMSISHMLAKYLKIDLRNYVNNVRVQNVLLLSTKQENKKKNITELALSCGFKNATTYYRAHKKFGF